jgi:hypothetical protein
LIDWLIQRKPSEQRGLAPLRLVELSVNRDVGLDARRRDADLAGAPVEDRRGRGRELKRGDECENCRRDWVAAPC